MSRDKAEKFWNEIYILKKLTFFMYTSTFTTKTTLIFQYTNEFNNS